MSVSETKVVAAKPSVAAPKTAPAPTPKVVAKVAVKAAAKPAPKAPAKAAKKLPVVKPAVKPAVQAAAKAPAKPVVVKPAKVKKPKMVRDSFTMPKPEFAVLDILKLRAAKLAVPTKKTELIRAGIKALAAMPDAAFLVAVRAVPNLKTGRPSKAK